MTITLKEQHRINRLRRLNETTHSITAQRLQEQKNCAFIVEALDKEKFAQAAAVLKKLQDIDFGRMEYFKSAVQHAMKDVNDALGGTATVDTFSTGLGKIMNAAQTKLSSVVKNPIPNVLAFVSALEQAFEQSEALIQHNFSNKLATGLKTNKISQEKVLALSPRKLVGEKSRTLENALVQAFSPEGILAKLGLTWKKRYLDPSKAAAAIMDAPMQDIIKTARSFKQGPQMSDVAQDLSNVTDNNQKDDAQRTETSSSSMTPDNKDDLVSKIAGITDVRSTDVAKVVDMLLKRGMLTVKSEQ